MPEKKPRKPAPRPAAAGRRADGTDPDIKAANLRRLARVEGQVRGVRQMVEDERYCADILDQIAAVQQAMRAVAREVLRNHLEHCARNALAGSDDDAQAMRAELLKLFDKRMH